MLNVHTRTPLPLRSAPKTVVAETLARRTQASMVNELGREPYFADVPCDTLLQRKYPAHFAEAQPGFSVYFRRTQAGGGCPQASSG